MKPLLWPEVEVGKVTHPDFVILYCSSIFVGGGGAMTTTTETCEKRKSCASTV